MTIKDSVETPLETIDDQKTKHINKNFNIGKIFWGLLLVVIGVLLLASNFGMVNIQWGNLWRLWPLFIVSAGLSIISLRSLFWQILKITFTVLTLAAIVFVMIGNYSGNLAAQNYSNSVQKISDIADRAEINVEAGVNELNITTADQLSVVESNLESNVATVSATSTLSGNVQQINLSMKVDNNWWTGNAKSLWNISLSRNLPIGLSVHAGASDVNIDVSQARLKSVDLKTGASSVVLKLGNRESVTAVDIESGVSSILVKVPNNSGIRVELENGLTDNSLADLVKVGDNEYESTNYDQATAKVDIVSKIGVSSFTIERY